MQKQTTRKIEIETSVYLKLEKLAKDRKLSIEDYISKVIKTNDLSELRLSLTEE